MAQFIDQPIVIEAVGNKPKMIEEFIGSVNSNTAEVSIARIRCPSGWIEPGQVTELAEYTVVLKGMLHVTTKKRVYEVKAGQAIIIHSGEWVQYSAPTEEGAEFIAVCLPAFTADSVRWDDDF